MVCSTFFARVLHVQQQRYTVASLGITVWIIYTTDHLIDVHKLSREASSQRHRFHQKNFNSLLLALIVGIGADCALSFFILKPILYWGIGLALAVGVYLCFQQRLLWFKELLVSFVYAAGVLLPTMALMTTELSGSEIILIVFFTLTAFINLVLFSWYDQESDSRDSQISLVTIIGNEQVKRILVILFLIQAILFMGLVLDSTYRIEASILFLMNVALLIIFRFPDFFSDKAYYRTVGDTVFLFPLPYLLLNG